MSVKNSIFPKKKQSHIGLVVDAIIEYRGGIVFIKGSFLLTDTLCLEVT